MISIAVVIAMPPSTMVLSCQHKAASSAEETRRVDPPCLDWVSANVSSMDVGVRPRWCSVSTASFGLAACTIPSLGMPPASRAVYMKLGIGFYLSATEATRRTSSVVVWPLNTARMPLSRRLMWPFPRAAVRISASV